VKTATASRVPRQYEIWWVSLPDPVGRRPVLLLGRSASFTYMGRVLAAEVTTVIRSIPQEVDLGPGDGMRRRCVANLDALRTVPRGALRERLCSLAPGRHVDVKRALGHVLAWPELTAL